jgi:hypothetical protein
MTQPCASTVHGSPAAGVQTALGPCVAAAVGAGVGWLVGWVLGWLVGGDVAMVGCWVGGEVGGGAGPASPVAIRGLGTVAPLPNEKSKIVKSVTAHSLSLNAPLMPQLGPHEFRELM